MRTIEKVLVPFFIVLEAAAALLLVVISVHGPGSLPVAAGIFDRRYRRVGHCPERVRS